MRDLLERLAQAAAGWSEQPAVVVAAQPALLDDAVREVRAAVRAVPVDQAVGAPTVLVQDEILAEEPDRLDRSVVQLGDGGDRHPVAPEQLAHRRAAPDLGEHEVLLVAQHAALDSSAARDGSGRGRPGRDMHDVTTSSSQRDPAPAPATVSRRPGSRAPPLPAARPPGLAPGLFTSADPASGPPPHPGPLPLWGRGDRAHSLSLGEGEGWGEGSVAFTNHPG